MWKKVEKKKVKTGKNMRAGELKVGREREYIMHLWRIRQRVDRQRVHLCAQRRRLGATKVRVVVVDAVVVVVVTAAVTSVRATVAATARTARVENETHRLGTACTHQNKQIKISKKSITKK